MLGRRTFQVVVIAKDRAVPFSFTPTPDKTVVYAGEAVSVRM